VWLIPCGKKFWCGVALALLLACAQALAEEVIIVGGEDGYWPYETLDEEGRPAGFNVDLMRAIARETGQELRFQLGEWTEMRQALDDGKIDVLGMFVSERRQQNVDFATPHIIVNHRIFTPASGDHFDGIDALEGHSVIVQRGAYSHEYLQALDLSIDLVLVDNDAEGLKILASGEYDAALLTEHRGRYAMQREGFDNLAVSGRPVLPVEYALAVRQGNTALLETLETGMQRVMASGEFDRLYAQWLQPMEESGAPGRVLTAVLMVIASLLAVAVGWLLRRLCLSRREMRGAQVELAFLREHDRLTGVLSRSALERRIEALCQRDRPGIHSLLLVNIDKFRIFNDSLGHAGADRLLCDLAERLSRLLPEGASVARFGADEFAILLTNADGEIADGFGRTLTDSLTKNPLLAQDYPPVTLSIGRVTFDENENSMARILRCADCACLVARENGGNQMHAWRPDDHKIAEKFGELGWVPRIQLALRDDRLVLYWQPIVSTEAGSHRTLAVEILVRMLPEVAGEEPISAGCFMPAAERYFVATEVDRRVLDLTLAWMEENPGLLQWLDRVNVNLSGRSLGEPQFLGYLEQCLQDKSGLITKLCLEVTETALISNLDRASEVLKRLHRRGCGIALDDFGTGMASMGYLRRLPVDYVKIDGSFVMEIEHDPDAFHFVCDINKLAHKMGKTVVAEGVETRGIAEALERAGINLMQGYFFGYPAELAALESHLLASEPLRVKESSQL